MAPSVVPGRTLGASCVACPCMALGVVLQRNKSVFVPKTPRLWYRAVSGDFKHGV